MRISDWSSDVCSSDLEAGGVPARAPRLVCCWALSGRDLVKKSLGIIGLFGANRGELVYARNMFEELRDALENLVVTAEPDAVAELHRLHGILDAKTAACLAALDSSGEWAADGSVSMSSWMRVRLRSEEQTSEHQSLMCNSYAVLCLT